MADPMTLDEVRALLEGATPGPWLTTHEAGEEYYGDWLHIGPALLPTELEVAPGTPPPDARLIAAAPDLAQTVIALHAEIARLRRILAVECGDKAQAPPGWRPMSDGWVCRNGPVFDGRLSKCPRPDGREVIGSGRWWKAYHDKIVFSPSALEAMEAADRARGGGAA